MHCLDLGVFADALGGLFFVEISNKAWHRSYQDGIDWLNTQLEGYYRASPGKSEVKLTLPMVKPSDGSHPTLKVKAAVCRHLAQFAVYLARRHERHVLEFSDPRLQPHSAEYRNLAVTMAEAMEAYHVECAAETFSEVRCLGALDAFIASYNSLRLLFRRDLPPAYLSAQVFSQRPKLHLTEHLHQAVEIYGSPRSFWCYGDEDFVGFIKRIAMKSSHPRSIDNVLANKYRLFSALHSIALAAV